ncbi:MAG: FtsX-like permease family protein [Nitrospirae bacterium]|nr:FtsX-like permease family protein [Nitrospirota bacterium]
MKNNRNQSAISWFLMFFIKSVSQRKGRVIIASISVTLAVAVITALIGVTAGMREKLGSELKAYGANIIVSPQDGGYLDYGLLGDISRLKDVDGVSGQVLGRALGSRQAIEIIGLETGELKGRGWRLAGNLPGKPGEILAGTNLKDMLKLERGSVILLESEGRSMEFAVKGFIERGGSEDSAVIMAIPDAWELLDARDKLSAVLVRGRSAGLSGVVKGISGIAPGAAVKTLRQVAVAEESLLAKIQLLMALVTLIVIFASGISVAGTMGANVLERREEIGLMRAIGATRGQISRFYMIEAVLIGISGGVIGYAFGYLSAQVISKGAFNSFISMPFYIFFLSLAAGLAVSLLPSHFPVRDAMRYNPAVILRGE